MEDKCILGFDEVFEDGIMCDSPSSMEYEMDEEKMTALVKEQIQLYYSKENK